MKKTTDLLQLRETAARILGYFTGKMSQIAEAMSDALTELDKSKQDKLTGTAGQVAGFDVNGRLTAISADSVLNGTGVKPFVKTFTAASWTNHTITIPASEHGQAVSEGVVLAQVYMLSGTSYTWNWGTLETVVTVDAGKNVILSCGEPYAGKIILAG